MAYAAHEGEWVRELFAGLGPLQIKKMFGAGAVSYDGLMFALIDDGVLWMRADDGNVEALKAAGSRQFTFPTKTGELMHIGYWSMPETALDDPDEALVWARQSLEVAVRKAAKKSAKSKKKSS